MAFSFFSIFLKLKKAAISAAFLLDTD